jgi:integrase
MDHPIKLKLQKKVRPKGLFLYCNGCNTNYSDDRKVKCKCGQLTYKAIVHIAGTKRGVRTKVLKASDLNEAIVEFLEFKRQLSNNSFQRVEIKKQANTPTLLVECFAYYMGFLNNVGVPKHKQKERDPHYIRKVDHAFEMYLSALSLNDIDRRILKFTEVTEEMVGFIHDYFLEELNYSNKTYNNNMGFLRAFTSHVIEKFRLDYQNPFLGVPDRLVTPKVTAVRENEFIKLLEMVTPENGVHLQTKKNRTNPLKTNLYRPWMKNAFKVGLFTGGRSEDIVQLKWTDIILAEDGTFDTLRTIDHKIDKANSNITSTDDRMYKYFAITKELGDLLLEMGYNQYKGTEKYIIATEDQLSRAGVSDLVSRAFSHYYKQLNTGKEVSFRNLRKTFMTSALREFGVASTALTNHKTVSMTNKHYYDKAITRDEAKETFSVFKRK